MNHYSPKGTYLLSHHKRRIAKKHANSYRKEHSCIKHKGPKVYTYSCSLDGFVVYSCMPYRQIYDTRPASLQLSVALYIRNLH
jgi:uncharacterized protein with WD repeat